MPHQTVGLVLRLTAHQSDDTPQTLPDTRRNRPRAHSLDFRRNRAPFPVEVNERNPRELYGVGKLSPRVTNET